MTYHQQRREYEDAVLQKRLDELTPEALEALQAEIEQEKKSASKPIQ
jgi:cytochrome c-type biogenesis protein CcmH/NrfG